MADEGYALPSSPAPVNHGRTRASWVLVILVLVGALTIGIGLAIGNVPVWVAGIIIALSGMVAGVVMRGRGLGQPVPERTRTDWYGDRA